MEIHKLSDSPSVLHQYLLEIRDDHIQKDRLRFRRNIERIGELMAYEISKTFDYSSTQITTPLSKTTVQQLNDPIVICSVLRAGVPLHQGILNVFDSAENAFISAYRKPKNNDLGFEIIADYVASPDLSGKTLLIADPMLATGQSLLATYQSLLEYGQPKSIHVACIIGSKSGVEVLNKALPGSSHLWIADIDPELNTKNYIVPGLGDAGDLSYGPKL